MRGSLMLRRLMDGSTNPLIGSAAAEIAGHCRVDILVTRILVVFKEGDRLHDLAGLAVAALWHADFHPCRLYRMRGRDAFNRSNFGAADLFHGKIGRAAWRESA